MTNPEAPASSATPLIGSKSHARSLPVLQRFRYFITLHLVRLLINLGLALLCIPGIRDRSIQPTSKKRYSCHRSLANRIYLPRSHKPGSSPLPVYLHIHGGGFAWTNPVVDDSFCSNFSNNNSIIVVSLDYPKSPSYRFPTAVQALTDLVNAVLDDDSLPIDKSQVAIGGFSAGGNLACAVSQSKTLQGKIGGLVAFYPPANFLPRTPDHSTTNPNGAGAALPQDQLSMFSWGYVEAGQDLRDPILSPIFAPRESLPPKICIFGCELDLLCRQEEIMAEKLASCGSGQRNGSEHAWERNGVKWEKILGEDHAFDQRPAFGHAKVKMRKRGREMYESAAEWLLREVYAPQSSQPR
ncbi:hypothetical protein V495_04395 [Pseudogymnoascus sp. VKM F-4514 (FW-929)]|nr:hypothetical protein V495_04395 [Pseudogymnoascus sp. VKM F-4514 (FW-929)]KFY51254.1 hypothetical protein V497_09271 [Pseudogymnoascus sp. VKM F-4516 (FW-969)]